MKTIFPNLLSCVFSAAVVMSAANGYASLKTFSATSAAAWNVAGNWTPSGIPAAGDDVIIPAGTTCNGLGSGPQACASLSVGGTLTLNGYALTVSGATIVSNAATLTISSPAGSKTFGDFTVQSGGVFNGTANGAVGIFTGNVTNNGNWNAYSGGQSETNYFAGVNNVIAGTGVYSNQSSAFSGTYTILPGVQFYLGQNSAGAAHLTGAGALTNQGTIYYHCSPSEGAPGIVTLDCGTPGNTFIWTNVNTTITPKAIAYYNLVLGNLGTSGANLNGSGLAIANNLTLVGLGNISSWPANSAIGGALIYATTASSASTLPAVFSVGAFNQASGKLALPANGTLTVAGTGSAVWTLAGGSLAQNAGSTVKFTGASPGISGAFNNLLIDSTVTTGAASAPFIVTNSLAINAGGSLDLTALTTYVLGDTESVTNSGAIVGNVGASSNSKAKIFIGTDGGYGTNVITGNVTLGTTNSVNFDVNSTAAGANDLLTVGGTLTLNNTVFNLKAPGNGAAIDASADYTLVTAGSISGTPVLKWVAGFVPANTNNYVLVVGSGAIALHNNSVAPSGLPAMSVVNDGKNLTVSWDSTTFAGYSVQCQTNASGIGANWSDTGSGTISPYITPIDPANSSVFFRLAHP